MTEHFDVLVVGAGLSGIGAGYHLQANAPTKRYAICCELQRLDLTCNPTHLIQRVSMAPFMIKQKFTCTYRGKVAAKGKGEVDMYFVDAPVLTQGNS